MSTLDGKNGTVNNGLVTLLVPAKRCDLRQQVVEPCTRARVAVSSRQRNVVLAIDAIFAAQSFQAVQEPVSHGSVSGLRVEDQIDEAVIGVVDVGNDKGAAVQTLAQARALLVKVGISSKVDFDHGAGDVGLANADEILLAIRIGGFLELVQLG